ncbi:NUDIX hydrolase [Natrarchaeobius chitinivorans]|uniref:NUDIX hydrolase n=2 Tax=Natrarchaeobius chitinivorans TaxID=1679083 RepID=A0A3N6MJN6_NATCH|nr:NUDIX hydrolase [Natrarchaeobius chitinivorans]
MRGGWDATDTLSLSTVAEDHQIRAGAKARITTADCVLLVQERHADGSPFWTLPGGGVMPDESLTQGLRRELREELDCPITIGTPRETVWYAHASDTHTLTAYRIFDCYLLSDPRPNFAEGISDYQWVPRDAVPPTTLPQFRFVL